MGLFFFFFRQEYWNGWPFPSPRDFSRHWDQTCVSCISGRFFTTEPPGKLLGVRERNEKDSALFEGKAAIWRERTGAGQRAASGWLLCATLETCTHARGDLASNWLEGSGAWGVWPFTVSDLPLATQKPCMCVLPRTNPHNPPHQRLISTLTTLVPHSLRGRGPPVRGQG